MDTREIIGDIAKEVGNAMDKVRFGETDDLMRLRISGYCSTDFNNTLSQKNIECIDTLHMFEMKFEEYNRIARMLVQALVAINSSIQSNNLIDPMIKNNVAYFEKILLKEKYYMFQMYEKNALESFFKLREQVEQLIRK
jgi:hypothetical protein